MLRVSRGWLGDCGIGARRPSASWRDRPFLTMGIPQRSDPNEPLRPASEDIPSLVIPDHPNFGNPDSDDIERWCVPVMVMGPYLLTYFDIHKRAG